MHELRARYLGYRRYALLIGAALLSAMVIWGDLVVHFLYKPAYAAAAWDGPDSGPRPVADSAVHDHQPGAAFAGQIPNTTQFGNALWCLTMVAAIPLSFHFWGLKGIVCAVAAGDFPLYCVFLVGAIREGIRPLKQDLEMTAIFVGMLAVEFAARDISHSFV